MKRRVKSIVIIIAVALAVGMVPTNVSSAATKWFSKKLKIYRGESRTLKLKNIKTKKKKVKWSVLNPRIAKKRIQLKNKKKTSVTIVGKRAGCAFVKVSVGKKSYVYPVVVLIKRPQKTVADATPTPSVS